MNTITATKAPSKYCDEPHFQLFIDEQPLDKIIAQINPEYEGLVSTLLPWFCDEEEYNYSIAKILPKENQSISPVLMCPDDVDLWCTLIVAKIKVEKETVTWEKLGLENSTAQTLEELCSEVEWFDIKPFVFELSEYKKTIKKFKET
jgi:hypothetical protein